MKNNLIRFILIIIIGVLIGLFLGKSFNFSSSSLFTENSNSKFDEILNHVKRSYVDSVNPNQLIDHAISQTLKKLDPHSVYIPENKIKYLDEKLDVSIVGIGIRYDIIRDTINILSVLESGPAQKGGLISADKIIKIDGENVVGNNFDDFKAFEYLGGKVGSEVILDVKRGNRDELIRLNITRENIPRQSVTAFYMINKETGYIKISEFARNTWNEFRIATITLKGLGMQKMILDIQDNSGGFMLHAVEIADEMLKNNLLISFEKGKSRGFNKEYYTQSSKGVFEEGDIYILVNENSASASELLAGALQDHDRAIIIGRRTFGKGLVQTGFYLADSSEIRLTVARYYTPSGRFIQKSYDDYNKDINNRYLTGELFNKDSVKLKTDKKYKTDNGETIYGGGGIMPNFYVPLDTSFYYPFVKEFYQKKVIQSFAIKYFIANKIQLEKLTVESFLNDYKINNVHLKGLLYEAKIFGINVKLKEFEKNRNRFKTQLKAQFGQILFQDAGFYPIINKTDEIYLKALELININ